VYTVPQLDREGPTSYLPHNKALSDQAKRTTCLLEWDETKHRIDRNYYLKKQVALRVDALTQMLGWGSMVSNAM
jgi:DNA polymerase elongation subunit (family B)